MHNDQRNLETIPAGTLGIIPLESISEIGEKVDKYLVKWRCVREHEHEDDIAFKGYLRDSYILPARVSAVVRQKVSFMNPYVDMTFTS